MYTFRLCIIAATCFFIDVPCFMLNANKKIHYSAIVEMHFVFTFCMFIVHIQIIEHLISFWKHLQRYFVFSFFFLQFSIRYLITLACEFLDFLLSGGPFTWKSDQFWNEDINLTFLAIYSDVPTINHHPWYIFQTPSTSNMNSIYMNEMRKYRTKIKTKSNILNLIVM